ncbi:carbon dioxide concentrating mechanism protein [Geitlerinema sp. CS-897]|nr:carbon dioxide concentrating mechanism protein [Geitlerinema sp. CS-897]
MQRLPISSFDRVSGAEFSRDDLYICGEVAIHPSAAIATGVVLQAGANSRISIAAGVCIGLGTVIHAHNGAIEIETGANLGAGVLLVGACKIGAHACVGAASTVIDRDIAANCILPTASIVGDRSRPIVGETPVEDETAEPSPSPEGDRPRSLETSEDPTPPTPEPDAEPDYWQDSPDGDAATTPTDTLENSERSPEDVPENSSEPPAEVSQTRIIYGEVHLNRILTTLFPHAKRSESEGENTL